MSLIGTNVVDAFDEPEVLLLPKTKVLHSARLFTKVIPSRIIGLTALSEPGVTRNIRFLITTVSIRKRVDLEGREAIYSFIIIKFPASNFILFATATWGPVFKLTIEPFRDNNGTRPCFRKSREGSETKRFPFSLPV